MKPATEFLLIPFGRVDVSGAVCGGSFTLNFTRANADEALAWFRRRGRDLKIDYEHQSLAELNRRADKRAPAAGWISALEIRQDGLWASGVSWTATAARHLEEDEYRYHSPVILWTDDSHSVVKSLGPVALTNSPALGMRREMLLAASQCGGVLSVLSMRRLAAADAGGGSPRGGSASAGVAAGSSLGRRGEDEARRLARVRDALGLGGDASAAEMAAAVRESEAEVLNSVRDVAGLTAWAGPAEIIEMIQRLARSAAENDKEDTTTMATQTILSRTGLIAGARAEYATLPVSSRHCSEQVFINYMLRRAGLSILSESELEQTGAAPALSRGGNDRTAPDVERGEQGGRRAALIRRARGNYRQELQRGRSVLCSERDFVNQELRDAGLSVLSQAEAAACGILHDGLKARREVLQALSIEPERGPMSVLSQPADRATLIRRARGNYQAELARGKAVLCDETAWVNLELRDAGLSVLTWDERQAHGCVTALAADERSYVINEASRAFRQKHSGDGTQRAEWNERAAIDAALNAAGLPPLGDDEVQTYGIYEP